MHDAAGHECESSCNDKRAREKHQHDSLVSIDVMAPRRKNTHRQCENRQKCQKVDPAEWPKRADRVNEERADGDDRHQQDPEPAYDPMTLRAFGT